MKRPAVFFDRDNTLIACDEYLGETAKVVLVEGAAAAVARARQLGFATVVVSNQSGVARGYFTEEAVHAVNQRLDELLRDGNSKAVIDRHDFCPYHPDASIERYRAESDKRKPLPGMITRAAEALALDLSRSWVIGDAPRDIEAGDAAGCRTILFTDPSLKPSPAATAERKVEPDYVCTTLKEAMDFIERNTEAKDEGGRMKDEAEPVHPSSFSPQPSTPTPHPSPLPQGERGPAPTPPPSAKLESLVAEIVHDLRRRHEQPQADFSVSKLLAGIVQVIVLAILFMAFLNRSDNQSLMSLLLFALTLQAMTIALLIMGRQR